MNTMNVDHAIRQAIVEAVREQNQPAHLADKLMAWFSQVTNGNESIDDSEAVLRRLDTLFDAVEVPAESEE